MAPLSPGSRKAIGSLAILVWLTVWIVGAATIGGMLATAPKAVTLLFYAVAGLAWVIPLRPLFVWMNR